MPTFFSAMPAISPMLPLKPCGGAGSPAQGRGVRPYNHSQRSSKALQRSVKTPCASSCMVQRCCYSAVCTAHSNQAGTQSWLNSKCGWEAKPAAQKHASNTGDGWPSQTGACSVCSAIRAMIAWMAVSLPRPGRGHPTGAPGLSKLVLRREESGARGVLSLAFYEDVCSA